MAIGNMHKKFDELRQCAIQVMRADRQADKLITIFALLLAAK